MAFITGVCSRLLWHHIDIDRVITEPHDNNTQTSQGRDREKKIENMWLVQWDGVIQQNHVRAALGNFIHESKFINISGTGYLKNTPPCKQVRDAFLKD